jgi:transcription elongation factor Elf1
MPSGTLFDGTFWCEPCNRTFKSWELLHKHKGKMSDAGKENHIHCKICSADFETKEAHAIHLQRVCPQHLL